MHKKQSIAFTVSLALLCFIFCGPKALSQSAGDSFTSGASDGRFADQENGTPYIKFGVIDESGKYCVNPVYDCIKLARPEDLIAVKKDNRWRYINIKGETVIKPQFTDADIFIDGLALAKKVDKYGYIDKTGKFVIKPRFYKAYPFVNGMAKFVENGKIGFIDKQGRVVIQPLYDNASDFENGVTFAFKGKSTLPDKEREARLIDKNGKTTVILSNFERHTTIGDTRNFAVLKNHKWGIINSQGKFLQEPVFDRIGYFNDDLAYITLKGKNGYVNSEGRMIVEPKFDWADEFVNGMARVGITRATKLKLPDGREIAGAGRIEFGFIDKTGKLAVPVKFSTATYFGSKAALVSIIQNKEANNNPANKENNLYGLIDRKGNFIVKPKWKKHLSTNAPMAPCLTMWQVWDGKKSFWVDESGELFDHLPNTGIQTQYVVKYPQAKQVNLRYEYRKDGKKAITKPIFDYTHPFFKGYAVAGVFNVDSYTDNVKAGQAFIQGLRLKNCSRPDDALKYFDKATALDPGFGAAYYEKALLYEMQCKTEEALKNYSQANEFDFQSIEALAKKADILEHQGKLEEALKASRQCLSRYEDFTPILNKSARLKLRLEKYDSALEDVSKSLSLLNKRLYKANTNLHILDEIPNELEQLKYSRYVNYFGTVRLRADIYKAKGDYSRAIEDLKELLNQPFEPTSSAIREIKDCYLDAGMYAKALPDINWLMKNDQYLESLYRERAIANLYSRNYKRAIADCNRFLKDSPNCGTTWFIRSKANGVIGNTKEAELDLVNAEKFGYDKEKFANIDQAIKRPSFIETLIKNLSEFYKKTPVQSAVMVSTILLVAIVVIKRKIL